MFSAVPNIFHIKLIITSETLFKTVGLKGIFSWTVAYNDFLIQRTIVTEQFISGEGLKMSPFLIA